jgi:hypothetical protein
MPAQHSTLMSHVAAAHTVVLNLYWKLLLATITSAGNFSFAISLILCWQSGGNSHAVAPQRADTLRLSAHSRMTHKHTTTNNRTTANLMI